MEVDSLAMIGGNEMLTGANTYKPAQAHGAEQSASNGVERADRKPSNTVKTETEKDENGKSGANSSGSKNLSEDEIKKEITEANRKIRGTFHEFEYRMHKKTNSVMIKVINSETKEVITEIPPEKSLDAVAKMWELVGLIVDEKR